MNCAHYLSNWLIVTGQLKEKPSQSTCNCSKGRPIRSKDMRNIFTGIKMILVLTKDVEVSEIFHMKSYVLKMNQFFVLSKQMLLRSFWIIKLKGSLSLTKSMKAPNGNCFIYCEKSGQGHVYYGTKATCVHGTGSAEDFGMTYIEYYKY